jgi:hypothetical protein
MAFAAFKWKVLFGVSSLEIQNWAGEESTWSGSQGMDPFGATIAGGTTFRKYSCSQNRSRATIVFVCLFVDVSG